MLVGMTIKSSQLGSSLQGGHLWHSCGHCEFLLGLETFCSCYLKHKGYLGLSKTRG